MPTYVYHCLICEADFEEKYLFDQIEEHPPCPICDARFTVRGMSSFSFFSPGQGISAEAATSTSMLSHGPGCLCCYPGAPRPKKSPARKEGLSNKTSQTWGS